MNCHTTCIVLGYWAVGSSIRTSEEAFSPPNLVSCQLGVEPSRHLSVALVTMTKKILTKLLKKADMSERNSEIHRPVGWFTDYSQDYPATGIEWQATLLPQWRAAPSVHVVETLDCDSMRRFNDKRTGEQYKPPGGVEVGE